EMVNSVGLKGNSPRTACLNEAVDRGADYSTMALIRDSGSSSGAAGLNDQLPDAHTSVHVHDKTHLEDSYFSWGTQVDDLGLEQMRQLWASPPAAHAPTSRVTRCVTPTRAWCRSLSTSTGSGSPTR